ncbi:hypothetical protein ABL78_5747 [Leptomonas seymouri]|uniref:C3H1-type domain-containing protein n=1 Tax=Leptomonas seymouri TaxID=5684 RepID=A0A0N1I344_LEPSE|nr:hypothetical protein ABL78_5747 [Leptomonas seymouri]|eukprot:KPI85202.1 hypothetical protein ABL78_5747 [Leptomonas seymouri]
MWNMTSSPVSSGSNSRPTTGGASNYVFMATGGSQTMMALQTNGVIPGVVPPHDRTQEVCKYFVNGGCLRGANCPYLHELPDERHLDVNGLGFILNPNVHNAQKTVPSPQSQMAVSTTTSQPPKGTNSPPSIALNGPMAAQNKVQISTKVAKNQPPSLSGSSPASPQTAPNGKLPPPPRYNPPEPYLELNLPPALAFPLKAPTKDTATSLSHAMLQS